MDRSMPSLCSMHEENTATKKAKDTRREAWRKGKRRDPASCCTIPEDPTVWIKSMDYILNNLDSRS